MRFLPLLAAVTLVFLTTHGAKAEGTPEFTITIKNHQFAPAETVIPASTKVKLIIKNEDPTAEEFESHDFNREKVIKGGSQGVVYVGPLKPGTYKYFGEFNPSTAQGTIVAK